MVNPIPVPAVDPAPAEDAVDPAPAAGDTVEAVVVPMPAPAAGDTVEAVVVPMLEDQERGSEKKMERERDDSG